ncbi:MAG: hypothetical protein NW241_01210 [Bacteroidia bacterium]|nr:hypothetical protein [Bacteroidia bacterium]
MRISKTTQDKLHDLLRAQSYVVRYERGSFHGGYCIVKEQRTIILNKFHPLESKINLLLDIIRQLEFDPALLSEEQQHLLASILKP